MPRFEQCPAAGAHASGVGVGVGVGGGGGGSGASVAELESVSSVPSETELISPTGSSDGSLTASSEEQEIAVKPHKMRTMENLNIFLLRMIGIFLSIFFNN